MLDILEKLINTVSVSGDEEEISNVIRKLIEGYADEIKTDALGNLIALKKNCRGDFQSPDAHAKKVMIAAHMDEIGFIVTFIEDSGFLRISPVGGIDWNAVAFGEVLFKNGVVGVIIPEEKVKPND